jgi:hypothetical protein
MSIGAALQWTTLAAYGLLAAVCVVIGWRRPSLRAEGWALFSRCAQSCGLVRDIPVGSRLARRAGNYAVVDCPASARGVYHDTLAYPESPAAARMNSLNRSLSPSLWHSLRPARVAFGSLSNDSRRARGA